MKFTFICIVITILCSVSASGDLQIYPDYKYNYPHDNFRPRIRSNDKALLRSAYSLWPWPNVDIGDYEQQHQQEEDRRKSFNYDVIERNRELEELIDKTRNQLKKTLPYYRNPPNRYEDDYENYRNLQSRLHKIDRNQYEISNNPILSDVRPYPQDEDFIFSEGSDDIVDDEDDDVPKTSSFEIKPVNNYEGHSGHKIPHKTTEISFKHTEEASGRGALEEAKLVDDPTEFAYAPPDPRFYETPPELKITNPEISTLKAQGVINVNQRSEYGPTSLKSMDMTRNELGTVDENVNVIPLKEEKKNREIYILALSAGVFAAAIIGSIVIAFTGYTMHKHLKNAMDVEYPAYGVTGPNKDISPSGDRRLAQSAQMYHYQHQKQQIIAMERASGERRNSLSEPDSEEENEEGDYTVYECPGLAPTGEMEVKNPLFQDDQNQGELINTKDGAEEKK